MTAQQRKAAGVLGAIVVVGGVFALAVIPGGSSSSGGAAAGSGSTAAAPPARAAGGFGLAEGSAGGSASSSVSGSAANGPAHIAPADNPVGSSATATRVVRNGHLSLQVKSVTTAVARLTSLATSAGGYVQSSDTSTDSGTPQGDITLRVPVNGFDNAVAGAQRLGRTRSLTTSATDVTGHYVDLVARETALRQTRSTYLSILSSATTIGATLSVQQRVDDVQQQLDRLEGQRKVLAAQTADATLAVSLDQGHVVTHAASHRSGIGAAWHRSVHRFAAGFDAVVGVLGPLLLAVLLAAIIAGIGLLGYRGMRRVFS
jgi:hypothetical protein